MKSMRVGLAALASVALLSAGCSSAGGKTDPSADASQLVPADALAYVAVDTNLSSSQLQSAQAILDKFPIKTQLLQSVRSSLKKQGIDLEALAPSAGPEVDVALLRVDGTTSAVGFTQPKDEQAFDAQLDKQSAVHTAIDGWTVFADKQPFLDAVTKRTTNLSDDADYQEAVKTIPVDAIARAYATTAGLQAGLGAASSGTGLGGVGITAPSSIGTAKWVTAALTSQDKAFKLEVHAKPTKTTPTLSAPTDAALAGQIPAGSIVAISLTGGGAGLIPASSQTQITGLGKSLGFDLGALIDVFRGPVVAYIRPGAPVPEVTLAAKPPHPAKALRAVAQLLRKLAKPQAAAVATKVDGGTLQKLDLGSVALYYGVNAGRLVVTDSGNALAELQGSIGHLSGDGVFKEAKDGAGMPDDSQGFLYLDLKDALPALTAFAGLANQKLPASVEANLEPLRSVLVFGSREGGLQSFTVYVKTS